MAVDDSYTKLLLHFDGANGSTTFTDEAGKSVTRYNAVISTAQSKFGGASGYFDGTTDYLSLADSADWDFGSGNFTIDCWVYPHTTRDWQGVVAQRTSGLSAFAWQIMLNGMKVRFEYTTNGTTATGSDFNTALSTGQWYHIAIVRNGATVTCYINGVAEATTINIGTATVYNSSAVMLIGSLKGDGHYIFAYMDELRISKGIARWTSNFTVPSAAYAPPVSSRRFAQII